MLGLTAEQLGTVLLAGAVAILSLIGGKEGKRIASGRTNKAPTDVVEVAGAIVSDKAVAEWVRAADGLSSNITVLTRALDRNTEACVDMADEISAVATAVGNLEREIIRSK